MILLWLAIAVSFATAAAALEAARRSRRRAERLVEMYWDVTYQCGELRAELQRLSGDALSLATWDPPAAPASFVPFDALKARGAMADREASQVS